MTRLESNCWDSRQDRKQLPAEGRKGTAFTSVPTTRESKGSARTVQAHSWDEGGRQLVP